MLLHRRILTRLLLLNKPIVPRSPGEIEADVQRNYRWNFTVSVLDGIMFWFGFAFASSATIVPLFVSKVTVNPLLIGLVAMLAQAGWHLPQMFSADAIERSPRKKPILVNLGLFLERIPVLLWPLGALLSLWSPVAGLTVFIVGWAWHGFGAGLIAPAWQDLLARIIPLAGRGRMYGLTTFLGTGFAAAGALLSGYILEAYDYPWDFVMIFSIAAAGIFGSWGFLALTREPLGETPVTPPTHTSMWSRMAGILRIDHNFRRFLVVRVLYTLGTMGIGFVTVAAVESLRIADATVGYFTVILLLGQTVGGLIAGIVADRVGHKRALALGAGAMAVAFLLIVVAPGLPSYYASFALSGIATGVNTVSGLLIALEFAPANRRPTYVGIANSVLGMAGIGAPLVGGWLALTGYPTVFLLSGSLSLLSLVLLLVWIQDPRHTTLAVIEPVEAVWRGEPSGER